MPTDAFFKLEKEKKNILLQSAIKEFSALPYEKVSVFKIAQNAKVSRSGFYYYFKDKEDIYQYLIKQLKEEFIKELNREGRKYDLFTFSKKIFHLLAECKGTEREDFFKQMVANMKPDDTKDFFEHLQTCAAESHFNYLCDLEDLNLQSEEDLMGLLCLLINSTLYVLQRYMMAGDSLSQAEEQLDHMFQMIKYGVLK